MVSLWCILTYISSIDLTVHAEGSLPDNDVIHELGLFTLPNKPPREFYSPVKIVFFKPLAVNLVWTPA
jgi:hypothetical protein